MSKVIKQRTEAAEVASERLRLPLQELIRRIHEDLVVAELQRKRRGLPPLFEVESLELELQIAVSTELRGDGKVDVALFVLEAEGTHNNVTTHTLRLKLRVPPEGVADSAGSRPASESQQ